MRVAANLIKGAFGRGTGLAADMKMRDLEAKTGLSRESIRFYIREGLLPEPDRPRRNVATYSEAHVRAIETIRSLQKDPHLTLGMIKRLMQGEPVSISTMAGYSHNFGALLAHRLKPPSQGDAIPVAQLIQRQPLAKRYIEAFARNGFIDKIIVDGEECLDSIDARIVSIWVDARINGGFEEALGFGPHGIVPFFEAMGALAETVIASFIDQIRNRLDEAAAARLAQAGIEVSNAILPLLFTRAMFREAMKRSDTHKT